MSKIIKQCVGIDVSQDVFDSSFGTYGIDQSVEFVAGKKIKNSPKSFGLLLKWAQKLCKEGVPLVFVMEATGVYHEKLACFLYDNKQHVVVVLPSRASSYAKSLEVKTITDKEASRSLCRMGLEKKMDLWQKPDPIYNNLKQLTREREQLQKSKTICLNQIHAENKSAWPNQRSLDRASERLHILKSQIKQIEKEIKEFVAVQTDLQKKIDFITTIPGVALLTAATVIGETNGFAQIENKRQLVSYSGYDVIRKDSGTSVHAKPKISKKGNRHIRKAMHYPALTSIQHNEDNHNQYVRLIQKHGIKMKAAVAIQRKVLVLIYTLWKKEQIFDEHFNTENNTTKKGQLALP